MSRATAGDITILGREACVPGASVAIPAAPAHIITTSKDNRLTPNGSLAHRGSVVHGPAARRRPPSPSPG